MELTEILLIVLCTSALIISIIGVILILKKNYGNAQADPDEIASIVRNEIGGQMSTQRQELSTQIQSTVKNMGDMISANQTDKMSQLEERIINDEKVFDRGKVFPLAYSQYASILIIAISYIFFFLSLIEL